MAGAYHSIWTAIGSRDTNTRLFTPGSLNANVTTAASMFVGMCPIASATFTIESGTPSGTFYVDVTDDARAEDPNGGFGTAQWTNVQSVTFTNGLSAGASSAGVTWQNGTRFVRVRWVQTGGTGTGFAFLTGVSN
jgi:hypothetical protein